MKLYTLKFNKADFVSTDFNLWRTPIVDLYDNDQYRNFSVRRSNYGTDLLGNGVYTGMSAHSATESEIGYVDDGRFVDTTSKLDIVAWNVQVQPKDPNANVAKPNFTLNIFNSADPDAPLEHATPGSWANQQNIRITSDIYMVDAQRYAYFELDFERGDMSDADYAALLDNFDITLFIRVRIGSPTIDAFYSSTGSLLSMFPEWMDINEYDPADPNYSQMASPNSLGGQVLNALAGEWLNDLQSKIEYQKVQHYIDTVDLSQKAWVYRTTEIPDGYIHSITGDGIPLAQASTLEEFHATVDDDHAYYWNRATNEVFVNVKYDNLVINETTYGVSLWHVWNGLDDLGATVDLFRHRFESNHSFHARIKDVYINKPGTSLEAFKNAVRRELNLWQFYTENGETVSDQSGGYAKWPGTTVGLGQNILAASFAPEFNSPTSIGVIAKIRPHSWTRSDNMYLAARMRGSVNVWRLMLQPTGNMFFGVFDAVQGETSVSAQPAGGFAQYADEDGWLWVAGTFVPDDGSGNRIRRLYYSTDGIEWVNFATNTNAGVYTVRTDSLQGIDIGAIPYTGSFAFAGDIGYMAFRGGVTSSVTLDGSNIFVFDGTELSDPNLTSFTSRSGHQVTVQRETTPLTIVPYLSGSTPNSYFTGATPDVLEISDIEKDPLYFTDRGLPTQKFKDLVEELARKYPISWGYFRFDQAYWDQDGIRREGVDYLPRLFDATPVTGNNLDSGVGDGNDLFLFKPDFVAPQIDFTTNLKIRGRHYTTRPEYQPVKLRVAVYGRSDYTIYNNPTFTGWFTIEVVVDGTTYFTPVQLSAKSDVNATSATPSTESLAVLDWTNPAGFTSAGYLFYNKATGQLYASDDATANNLIHIDDISSVTILPGRWNPQNATYDDKPTLDNYRLWFKGAGGDFLGYAGNSVSISQSPFDPNVSDGTIVLQSLMTQSSPAVDEPTAEPYYETEIILNNASPATSPQNFTLTIPQIVFPENSTNREIIIEIVSNDGTTYGATGTEWAATPVFLPSSMIQVNGNATWTSGRFKSFSANTTSVTFSTGSNAVYPAQVPVWSTFEATLTTPIAGIVDRNGPWRDGLAPNEGNTNYVLEYLSLKRSDFGIPNTSAYVLTWIGVDSVSSDDINVWLDSNSIVPAVNYVGESNLMFQYPDDAVHEIYDDGEYILSQFPLYVRVKEGFNRKWNPKIHSGWFYDDEDEYYLYANPRTVTRAIDNFGTGHVKFNGGTGNVLLVPGGQVPDISGDITFVARIAMDDWGYPDYSNILSKWDSAMNSWIFRMFAGGKIAVALSATGSGSPDISAVSTESVSFSEPGEDGWVAATVDIDNGSGGSAVKFWESADGMNWTQVGNTITGSSVASLFTSSRSIAIGQRQGSGTHKFMGKIFSVSIRSGIGPGGSVGGTEVFGLTNRDFVDADATSITASTGQVVSVGRAEPELEIIPFDGSIWVNEVNRQGAPIILYGRTTGSDEKTELRQVSSFEWDESATPAVPKPSLVHVERVTGNGRKVFYAAYRDIYDINVKNLTHNTVESLAVTDSSDNVVELTSVTDKECEYEIAYRVRNSYCVEMNYDDNPTMRILFDDPEQFDVYEVIYESAIYNPATPIDVPLNPMFTSMDEGFVYIDHDVRPLGQIEIHFSPSRIVADGLDYGLVTVKTIDNTGNPKPFVDVDVFTNFGTLSETAVRTDETGFAYVTLTSEQWDGSLNPSPATPALDAPSLSNQYRGQVLAVVDGQADASDVASFSIEIPDTTDDRRLMAAPATDAVLADGQSALGVVGKIVDGSHQPMSNVRVYWRKGRTVYQTLQMEKGGTAATPGSNLTRGYVTTDANGRFTIEPFISSATPGYWFVSLEATGYAASPTSFPAIGDVVAWYEYPNVNAASDPITNLPVGTAQQDELEYWTLPKYTLGSAFPVNYDEDNRNAVGNSATPQWTPPRWYAIDRYRQYQMGLRGNDYYTVGATPSHPDYKEF